jgi:hypothetical protein
MIFHFLDVWLLSLLFYSVSGNADSMVLSDTFFFHSHMTQYFVYGQYFVIREVANTTIDAINKKTYPIKQTSKAGTRCERASSSTHHSPLWDISLSKCSPSRLISPLEVYVIFQDTVANGPETSKRSAVSKLPSTFKSLNSYRSSSPSPPRRTPHIWMCSKMA